MNFYEKVCAACSNKNMSLSNLLLQMNMSKSNIRNWKNGVVPKIAVRTQIAKITEAPIEEFLTTEEIEAMSMIK